MCIKPTSIIRSLFLLLLTVVLVTSISTFSSFAATSEDKVAEKLENLTTKSGFIPGSRSSLNCKTFADSVSKKLFGTKTGTQNGCAAYQLKSSDYKCVGTLKNANKSSLVNLLKKAKPGDVIQYRSNYTNPFHTSVIYKTYLDGIKVINIRRTGGRYYVKLDRMYWSSITGWPGIGSISGGGRGLSLYHFKDYEKLYKNDPVGAKSITLDKINAELNIDDTLKLKATIFPANADNKKVTWSSSDKKVATVNNGKIKILNEGRAEITAKTSNGKTAKCKITVVKELKGPAATLNKKTLTLGVGEAYKLKGTLECVTEDCTPSYLSSNSSIVSVDDKGRLTAKAVGSADITFTCKDGAKATCKVTVKKAPTQIKIAKSITLKVGKSYNLKYYLNGAASNQISYITSNSSVAKVSSTGLVTAKKAGTATIKVKTYNGKTATCKVTVKK